MNVKEDERTEYSANLEVLQQKIVLNLGIIITLVKNNYPGTVLADFQKETTEFKTWKKLLDNPLELEDTYWRNELRFELKDLIPHSIIFLESLFVSDISVSKEVTELEFQLESLTTQLALGQINEDTYRLASGTLRKKIAKLKLL